MMLLTRLWLFVLTLVGGLLLLAVLLSPAQVRRSVAGSVQSRLDLAQQSATLLLANSARLWMDTAAQLASDAALAASLEENLRGQAEPELLHRTLQQHIRKAAEALRLSFVLLTDPSGRVLARVGRDEALHRDLISGYPLVEGAVRGYRLDDLWLQGGVLYRMAAAPVIGPLKDRYVGAIILGQSVGDELAAQLHAAIGMDVVFMGAGKILASSRPREAVPAELLQFAIRNAPALQGGGRSAPLSLRGGAEMAVLVGLPGDAAARGLVMGLIMSATEGGTLRSVLTSLMAAVAERDVPMWQLAVAVAAILGALFIGLALLHVEGEGPCSRLVGELHEIARRPPAHLDESRYRGRFRELCVSINAALRAGLAEAPAKQAEGTGPSVSAPATDVAGLPIASGAGPALSASAPGLVEQRPPSVPFSSSDTVPQLFPPSAVTPRRAGADESARLGGGIHSPLERSAPTAPSSSWHMGGEPPPVEAASAKTLVDRTPEAEWPPPHLTPLEQPTVQDIPPNVVQAALEQALGPPVSGAPARPVSFALRRAATGSPAAELHLGAASMPPDLADEITALSRAPTEEEEDLEASFRRTYQEFIVTKQRCNEPIEGLTYDKFAHKLRQSREQIMRQHKCRTVRFHVYIKDGKAALKATPVNR
ncbi:MAG: MXAN_5187 family protein [Myxococcales bacterium]|nr:hypothetical protein [Myxococcota bacterium]MDW8281558.1 MXAN_5187 family protein [Myxococcales bacterium]